jgi:hypothetical protein
MNILKGITQIFKNQKSLIFALFNYNYKLPLL